MSYSVSGNHAANKYNQQRRDINSRPRNHQKKQIKTKQIHNSYKKPKKPPVNETAFGFSLFIHEDVYL